MLFVFSLILAFVVGFVFLFVGNLSFWTPEANHLQNVISLMFLRVFSGVLIPISFFSGTVALLLLAFSGPGLFTKSMIMQSKVVTGEVVTIILATTFLVCSIITA